MEQQDLRGGGEREGSGQPSRGQPHAVGGVSPETDHRGGCLTACRGMGQWVTVQGGNAEDIFSHISIS